MNRKMGFPGANAGTLTMEEFKAFLTANNWNGKHLHRQMKKYAALVRRMGGSLNKTYNTLAQAWTKEDSKYWVRDRNIKRVIQHYGQDDQRTAAWHSKRSEMITASEVGYIVEGTPSQRHEVMMRKVRPESQEQGRNPGLSNPLVWGTKLEPIAKRVYETQTSCTIRDVSCVQHPRISFLGASPDGIIQCPEDRERHHALVEFKCPISRKIGGEVPRNYYHQMQLQMECTGVDECEYVEFQFKTCYYSEWVDFKQTKGIFACYDDNRIEEWNNPPGPIEEGRLVYWILQGVHRDLVERDPKWLETHLPVLKAFWDEVCQHRTEGTIPDKPGVLKLTL